MLDRCLILMIKAPVVGGVQERLAREIGAERACEIYKEIVRSVYYRMKKLSGVFLTVSYAADVKYPDLLWLDPDDPGYMEQTGADSGERMRHAIDWAFRSGAKSICVAAGEAPELDGNCVEEAFVQLQHKDLALGAVESGGLYMLGLKRLFPHFFEGIDWTSQETFNQAMETARSLNLKVHEMPPSFSVEDEVTMHRWLESIRPNSDWSIDSAAK